MGFLFKMDYRKKEGSRRIDNYCDSLLQLDSFYLSSQSRLNS